MKVINYKISTIHLFCNVYRKQNQILIPNVDIKIDQSEKVIEINIPFFVLEYGTRN